MVTLAERFWRLIATMLLFVVFGLGGVLAECTILPAIMLFVRDPEARQRRSRNVVRISFRSFLRLMSFLGVCDFEIDAQTEEKFRQVRGTLIVGKHPTLIDVLVLLGQVEQANCIVKHTLRRNPFVFLGIRAANYISNHDVGELMSASADALCRGESLIVFPEATRTVPGRPLRLQRGAANIALRANATIQVLHIDCDPVFLSREVPWWRIPPRKPCFTVRAGVSLRAGDFLRSGESRTFAARRLTSVLTTAFNGGAVDGEAGIRAQAASH
jgi:1-acyl-sn-glycerol-3-phosphate acyltransferase